jgi:cobalt-zinc-cadmium efflux system membrane fusion protein
MKLSVARWIGVLGLIVGGLAVGWFLFRTPLREGPPVASSTSDGSAPPQVPATLSAPHSDAITFPKDHWASAGLRVEPAAVHRLETPIELTGKVALNEDRLSHVFPLVEGRVDEVNVRFGQHVKKGDLLVVVQSKEVGQGMLQLFQDRSKLEIAEVRDRWTQDVSKNTQSMIELMRAGASIETIEKALNDRPLGDHRQRLMTAYVEHQRSHANLERLKPLAATGAVPAREIMEAEAQTNATHATLQSLWEQVSQDIIQARQLSSQTVKELRTNIAVAETSLKILGLQNKDLKDIDPSVQGESLAHYPVICPFDGTIISKDVVLLERVGPERQILTIADLSTVWISADIYESHLPILSRLTDQTLRIRCEAWPDREFEARVFYTGDVVQESTRTIALRATAANSEGLLKPGMFVTVLLPDLDADEVLQVPLTAIQDHEGRSFVFIQTGDEEFQRRDITAGRRNQSTVEIRNGLKVGDRVVVEGGFGLKSRMLADLLAE